MYSHQVFGLTSILDLDVCVTALVDWWPISRYFGVEARALHKFRCAHAPKKKKKQFLEAEEPVVQPLRGPVESRGRGCVSASPSSSSSSSPETHESSGEFHEPSPPPHPLPLPLLHCPRTNQLYFPNEVAAAAVEEDQTLIWWCFFFLLRLIKASISLRPRGDPGFDCSSPPPPLVRASESIHAPPARSLCEPKVDSSWSVAFFCSDDSACFLGLRRLWGERVVFWGGLGNCRGGGGGGGRHGSSFVPYSTFHSIGFHGVGISILEWW